MLKILLTQKQFCSLKNIHLPEVYIKNLIMLLIKHITNLDYVRKNDLHNKPSSRICKVLIVGSIYSN